MKNITHYVQRLKAIMVSTTSLDENEAKIATVVKEIQDEARADIIAILEAWSHDMHIPSLRPCPTCEEASKAAKIRLGCCDYQDQQPKT